MLLAILLMLVAVFMALVEGDDASERLGLAARYTARGSFLLFLLVYSTSSMAQLWPSNATRKLLAKRRHWELSFGVAHQIHLGILTWYNVSIANTPGYLSLAGGGLAYVVLFGMMLTSNDQSIRLLGPWWKRLHTYGIQWIWLVFAFSYFGRMFDPERAVQGYVFTFACFAALALRVYAWRARATAPIPIQGQR